MTDNNKSLIEISFTQPSLSGTEKFVLFILCYFANNESYEVSLPQKEIAKLTGLDIKTVSKCIQSLQKKSMLICTNKYSGKTNTTRVYSISISYHENKLEKKPHQQRKLSHINRLRSIISLSKIHGYQCNLCKTVDDLEIDHIYPISKGGTDKLENLQLLCRGCNLQKSNN